MASNHSGFLRSVVVACGLKQTDIAVFLNKTGHIYIGSEVQLIMGEAFQFKYMRDVLKSAK